MSGSTNWPRRLRRRKDAIMIDRLRAELAMERARRRIAEDARIDAGIAHMGDNLYEMVIVQMESEAASLRGEVARLRDVATAAKRVWDSGEDEDAETEAIREMIDSLQRLRPGDLDHEAHDMSEGEQ